MSTFEPASYHHANFHGRFQNATGGQYQLATRAENARRGRRRSRSPAGRSSGDIGRTTGGSGVTRDTVKTVNTDLTRYLNSSSFRGTTPPQRLRYIFQPDRALPPEYVSDGRTRTWEEVPIDSRHRPQAYRDARGIEWLPVLSRDASDREWREWESRERRRVDAWEACEREYMDSHHGMHSAEWRESLATIHPWFLYSRRRDGSSHLLTPNGAPMTLLDPTRAWHDREYHHVGRDPLANYQTIFGGLEAEQDRQRLLVAEEVKRARDEEKHHRKELRDFERARRKEEKMRLKHDLESQRIAARNKEAADSEGHTKVVKKVIRHANGQTEVVFVKRRVGGTAPARSPSRTPANKPHHAPWGSSAAAHRNALRGPNGNGANQSRARSASRQSGGWMNPTTRGKDAGVGANGRTPSRSRSGSPRSRSRSTSSSRRRRIRREEKAARRAAREEERRKREHAKLNSTSVQAGTGDLPPGAQHPHAADLESYLLRESRDRRAMSLERLGATLNSLDKLSIGGVGRSRHARGRGSRSSSSSSSVSGSSTSAASGFSSRGSSPRPTRHAAPTQTRPRTRDAHTHTRRHSRSRSPSSSVSRSRRRHGKKKKSRSSHSHSPSSSSRSRSRSSSASSSSSSSHRRSSHRRDRRASLESMDARVRSREEDRWLHDWSKRYSKARDSSRTRRALKQERREWEARRRAHHTFVQAANERSETDSYLHTAGARGGELKDQYGTPIASYGTVYPKPQGTLLEQASVLDAYAASLSQSERLLAESRSAVEAHVGGIEHIVGGLRDGFATKGLDASEEASRQAALHLSLRAAIRAREDRRKKTAAMTEANRHVLDELRRQESVIMDRSKAAEENLALQAYERAVRAQRLQAEQAQAQAQAAMQAAYLTQLGVGGGRGRTGVIGGRRPRSTENLRLGGTVDDADPFWYEQKDIKFTTDMIAYNRGLRANLAASGAD